MNADTLAQGQWWIYRGLGAGKGVRHVVVQVRREEVITWSVPLDGEVGGWTWRGPVSAFLTQFTKI